MNYKKSIALFSDIHIHPHLFRHSFCSWYLVNGGDISFLKDIAGHSSLQITELYLHFTNKQVKDNYDKVVKNSQERKE